MKLSDFSEYRKEIFSLYEKQESDISADVAILREWMLKVPHLPSDIIGDGFLELCLLKNKFSIEKCKKKIEVYCTLKADPHYDYIYNKIPIPSREASFHTPLPILTADYKRLVIFKVFDETAYSLATDLSCSVFVREFLLRYDYNDGDIPILDLRNCSAGIINKFRLNVFADTINLVLHGMSARISAVHIVSKIGKTLMSSIVALFPKKLIERVNFHADEHSLKDFINPKYLPSDYGGEMKSLDEIRADWDIIFEENKEVIQNFFDTKSREELRLDDSSRKEAMQGTFRMLSID